MSTDSLIVVDFKVECNSCKKTYKNMSTLSVHKAMDCGKIKMYNCPACNYSCKRKFNLKLHILRQHDAKVVCDVCNKTYKNANTLLVHKAIDCGKVEMFSCPMCSFRSKRKYNMDRHILTIHCNTAFPPTAAALQFSDDSSETGLADK
nr:unnamed protein product [Callosobruchus chinensis]